jgi:hypothetical protein
MSEEALEKTFNVTIPALLEISNIRGSIQVRPGPENEIHVSAVKYVGSGDAARTEILIEQDADGTVRAETRFRHPGPFLFGDRPCKVEYVVTVPQRCSIDCKGVSSSASVQGLQGEFRISTVSGGIQAEGLLGSVRLHTVSGRISGHTLSGELDYDTVSGDLRLVDSSLAQVRGSSISGGVWLQTGLAEGPYQFKTVSGSLYLLVPPGSACTIESNAISGSLVTDLPVTRDARQAGHRRAEVGGGGVLLQFNGVSGNISVLAGEGGGAHAASAGQPAQEATGGDDSVDTNDILDKIERGEITVDEGIARLKNKK